MPSLTKLCWSLSFSLLLLSDSIINRWARPFYEALDRGRLKEARRMLNDLHNELGTERLHPELIRMQDLLEDEEHFLSHPDNHPPEVVAN